MTLQETILQSYALLEPNFLRRFRIAVDSLPGMNGVRIQNSVDGGTLSAAGNGSSEIYPANFVVQGPAVVQFFTTNAAATSGTATAMVNYQVTQG